MQLTEYYRYVKDGVCITGQREESESGHRSRTVEVFYERIGEEDRTVARGIRVLLNAAPPEGRWYTTAFQFRIEYAMAQREFAKRVDKYPEDGMAALSISVQGLLIENGGL